MPLKFRKEKAMPASKIMKPTLLKFNGINLVTGVESPGKPSQLRLS